MQADRQSAVIATGHVSGQYDACITDIVVVVLLDACTRDRQCPRIEQPDEGLLFEVSDEALEAAANQTRAVAAMSFHNAPTVSILVMCCTNG
ncbi:MAG: hypothetical protein WBL77_15735 [Pseudolabrys sp.]